MSTRTSPRTLPASWLAERDRRRRQTVALLAYADALAPSAARATVLARVVELNRGVAEAVASRFRDRGVPAEDLRQAAYEGLLKAVRRFDPARGDLLTYAVPTIRGEVQRYFRDQAWMVRPPRRLQELQRELAEHVPGDVEDLRAADLEELAELARLDVDRCREALGLRGAFAPASLDTPVGGGEATLGELLGEDEPAFELVEQVVSLAYAVRDLSERERLILRLRFYDDLTQAEIGERIGVTQMQVSRLLSDVLARLRARLADSDTDPATA